jgi:hypothetical protein
MIISVLSANPTIATTQIIPLVSTRNHFSLQDGHLIAGHTALDSAKSNIPGLQSGTICPPEITMYIHGVWADPQQAVEQTSRTNISLNYDNYRIPIIGFTWDSNTAQDSQGQGWSVAKQIADKNGPKLANFLLNYLTLCNTENHQNTQIRIIAHSLGARVLLAALVYLNNNQTWNSEHLKIKSVNLLGAAVDQDSPSITNQFGRAIKNTVEKFYNLYDIYDDLLSAAYPMFDNFKFPLGMFPASYVVSTPNNFVEQNVASDKMYYKDADGDRKFECYEDLMNEFPALQNHCAYMGVRDLVHLDSLRDGKNGDGAMQFVVDEWNHQR